MTSDRVSADPPIRLELNGGKGYILISRFVKTKPLCQRTSSDETAALPTSITSTEAAGVSLPPFSFPTILFLRKSCRSPLPKNLPDTLFPGSLLAENLLELAGKWAGKRSFGWGGEECRKEKPL